MSAWIERVEQHPLRAAVAQTLKTIEAARSRADSSAELIEHIERIAQVVAELARRLDAIDPSFASPGSFDVVNGHIVEVNRLVEQFTEQDDLPSLQQADGAVDAILGTLHLLHVPRTPEDVAGLGEAIVRFRRSIGQHARNVGDQLEHVNGATTGLQQKLDELTADLTNQKTRVDAFISQAEQRIATAEAERSARFTATEAQHSELVQAAIRQFNEQHAAAEQRRSDVHDAAQKEMVAAAEALNAKLETSEAKRVEASTEALAAWEARLDQHSTAFSDLRNEIDAAAQEQRGTLEAASKLLIAELEARKKEAAEIVGIIANTGMAGSYQKVADAEGKAGRWWAIATAAALLALIAFTMYAFFSGNYKEPFSGRELAAKLSATAALVLFAVHAGREAHKHHENERMNRRTQLELESINPYLATLPDERRHTVKERLADRFFGRFELPRSSSDPSPLAMVADTTKEAASAVRELAKRK